MTIYLPGLLGFSLLTFLLIFRGKAMMNRAAQNSSENLRAYQKLVGQGMIAGGILSALMTLMLLITMLFEIFS